MGAHSVDANIRDILAGVINGGARFQVGDGPSSDSNGRFRVSNPVNLFLNKNIHTRNKSQWEEPIVGAIIVHGTVTSGPFQVAETVTGGTSGQTGAVTAVAGDNLSITYTINHNDFIPTETIIGGTSGATAAVTSIDTGSHVHHDRDLASVILQVGTSSGDQAVRQSHRYIPYVPGKTQLVTETFLFGTAVTNLRRRLGYFDLLNGLFFEQTTTGLRFIRRTSTSGSVVDIPYEQADWSEDTFDGFGPSKLKLDMTKKQYLVVDFQWQGTGRIRYGFEIAGRVHYAHYVCTSNVEDVPFISTPSLPIRYEITNTGATASINTLVEGCSAVASDGGEKLTGLGFTASNATTSVAVNTTEIPVLAVRLKDVFGGGENRRTMQLSNISAFTTGQNIHFTLYHVHDPSNITATWSDISNGSGAEYSTDITAYTGNPQHPVEEGYLASGQAGKGIGENTVSGDKLDQHRLVSQNYDSTNSEMFVITAQAFTNGAEVTTHISWIEFE